MLTARQDNRLTAAENTLAALILDPTPYTQDLALQKITQELGLFTTDLVPMRQQGLRPTKDKNKPSGATQDKLDRKALLATVAGEVAGDLYSYATDQQDRPLQATADFNQSSLATMGSTALLDMVTNIYNAADSKQAALADYGMTPARLQELRAAIDAFSAGKNTPGQQVSAGKNARRAIKGEFGKLTTLLDDRLDRSLRKYARSHPAFYQRVTQARQIIDRPGSRKRGDDETPEV